MTDRPSMMGRILEQGGLRTLFQPIMVIGDGARSLHGYECLTRGPADTNMEAADVLFEYVRRKREEPLVDRLCVTTAMDAAAVFPAGLRLTLNVHASTLGRDPDFVGFLAAEAERVGRPTGGLVVEIVEHAPPWNGPSFQHALEALRAIDVGIALDDVGLAQSNFKMILDARPDYLKIDRYFVKGVAVDAHRQAIVESIAHLAKKFGAIAVAEGIETEADLFAVEMMGIRLGQGHLFGRPAAAVQELRAKGPAPGDSGLG